MSARNITRQNMVPSKTRKETVPAQDLGMAPDLLYKDLGMATDLLYKDLGMATDLLYKDLLTY